MPGCDPLASLVSCLVVLACSSRLVRTTCTSCSETQSDTEEDVDTSLLQVVRGRVLNRDADATDQMQPSHMYPWSQRGRDYTSSSHTPHTAPSDFSAGPSWIWENTLDEKVNHSPLIDDNMDIYLQTSTRIRKISANGTPIWSWQSDSSEGTMRHSTALYEGAIFAVSMNPEDNITMYSIDMASGEVNWKKSVGLIQEGDAASVFVYNKTVVMALKSGALPGNDMMYAVNSSDGGYLWDYVADDIFWNWTPSTPGDGTLLAASSCGAVFRITFGGELVWRVGNATPGYHEHCCTGGGALGPNSVFYVENNIEGPTPSTGGDVSAYQVSDGKLLWRRSFAHDTSAQFQPSGAQYPAVGRLGSDGPLAVVVALGLNTFPPDLSMMVPSQLSSLVAGFDMSAVLPKPLRLPSIVVALNATSGGILWRFDEEPWDHLAAAGETAKYAERQARLTQDPRADIVCWPDPQGIPVIAGDGMVYTSSSHSGDLRAMKDLNGNGIIEPEEVSLFSTHNAFLNSPSVAPGMLVAAPCWGPMYVFKK